MLIRFDRCSRFFYFTFLYTYALICQSKRVSEMALLALDFNAKRNSSFHFTNSKIDWCSLISNISVFHFVVLRRIQRRLRRIAKPRLKLSLHRRMKSKYVYQWPEIMKQHHAGADQHWFTYQATTHSIKDKALTCLPLLSALFHLITFFFSCSRITSFIHRFSTATMATSDSMEAAHKALLAEVTTQDHALKHVEPPAESLSTTQAKVLLEVQGGKHELHHVNPPAESLSTTQAKMLIEVQGGKHELHHVNPPAESLSTTQAKMLIEVQGGNHELHHVDSPPQDGLRDVEKQAYLEEKQNVTE